MNPETTSNAFSGDGPIGGAGIGAETPPPLSGTDLIASS